MQINFGLMSMTAYSRQSIGCVSSKCPSLTNLTLKKWHFWCYKYEGCVIASALYFLRTTLLFFLPGFFCIVLVCFCFWLRIILALWLFHSYIILYYLHHTWRLLFYNNNYVFFRKNVESCLQMLQGTSELNKWAVNLAFSFCTSYCIVFHLMILTLSE